MAGTRLWISTIILAELTILAVLSSFYGLCVQNDDILCHTFSDSKNAPGSLRALERPSWWSTTLHIHLVVEQSQSLQRWAKRLEKWTKESQLEDLPYFGSMQIHMNVVPQDDGIWEGTGNTPVKISENSSIWKFLPDRQLGTIPEKKDLDWMLYIPANAPTEKNTSEHGEDSSMPIWSAWKKASDQFVTISTKMTDELDLSSLISLVGPWLQESSDSEFISSESSENDYLRKLQYTWHKTILQDFDDLKIHLTAIEKRDVLLALGKTPQSFSDRLRSLLQVRSVLEGVMERNKEMLASEFPLEHYAAVFLPLLFPLLMPFLASFVKELKRFKLKVKKKRQK